MIVGIALAMGILSVGAESALATDSCGKYADKQTYQLFTQETAGLSSTLTAKDNELREQYAYRGWDRTYEGIDVRKINALETEIKELKDKINASAQKYSIPACSRI